MDLEDLADRALVVRTQEGNQAAFSVLVERYQERVLNVVYRRLDDRELALDVAQEVFFKAFRGIKRFKGDSQFYTWIFRIAVNETISARRKQDRVRRTRSLDAAGARGERLPDPADSSYEPGAAAEARDELTRLRRAIHGLPEELSCVLVLRDIDGLSYAEVSEVLQIPIGSVKSRIHRARGVLKTQLTRVAP